MKKLFLYILLCVLCCLTSCSEEELNGNGIFSLIGLRWGASVPSTTPTLPTLDELNNGCVVKLRNSDSKLIREYEGISTVPSSLELVTGMYTISGSAGIKVDAAYDAPYYSGSMDFEIKRNQTTPHYSSSLCTEHCGNHSLYRSSCCKV